jgi:hypothetical protein
MGRPINKNRMFNDQLPNNEDSTAYAGRLEVTAYYPVGGSLQQNDDAYIMRQRGSNRFLISQGDSATAVYTLKGVAPASLIAGEMCVKVTVTNGDSTNFTAYVTRFYNRTINWAYVVNGITITGTSKYTLGTESGEGTAATGFASIDVI